MSSLFLNTLKLFPLFLLPMILGGCSQESLENVSPETVHQVYHVTVDDQSNTAEAAAYLEVGTGGLFATRLDMSKSPKSSLSVNGKALERGMNLRYASTLAPNTREFTFVYTDKEGKPYTNVARVKEIYLSHTTPTTISKKDAETKFRWDGEPLGKDETITLSIAAGSKQSVNASAFGERATEVKVTAAELKDLPNGRYPLYWTRQTNSKVQSGTERGGDIFAIFKSKQMEIEVRD